MINGKIFPLSFGRHQKSSWWTDSRQCWDVFPENYSSQMSVVHSQVISAASQWSLSLKMNYNELVLKLVPSWRGDPIRCGEVYQFTTQPSPSKILWYHLDDSSPLDAFDRVCIYVGALNPQVMSEVFKSTPLSLQRVLAESALERLTHPHLKPEEATCCSNSWPQCSLCQTEIYLSLISTSFLL